MIDYVVGWALAQHVSRSRENLRSSVSGFDRLGL